MLKKEQVKVRKQNLIEAAPAFVGVCHSPKRAVDREKFQLMRDILF